MGRPKRECAIPTTKVASKRSVKLQRFKLAHRERCIDQNEWFFSTLLEEVKRNIATALHFHIEALREDHAEIPQPTTQSEQVLVEC